MGLKRALGDRRKLEPLR